MDILIYVLSLFRKKNQISFIRQELNEFITTKMVSIEMLRVMNIR
jgi:hypothetical protein